jgi:stage IV sporulation protein FB
MFGIPVRVSPMFWLTSALLGYGFAARDMTDLVIWVLCVFVSVLLHELGHVLMGRIFGSNGQIVLMAFGGLALGATAVRYRWQRILVLFAGPGIQLLMVPALFFGVLSSHQIGNPLLVHALRFLLGINLVWPIFNLLPIWPLDGGQITREVCDGVAGVHGIRLSLLISIGVAGTLILDIVMSMMGQPLLPVLGGFLASPITAFFFAMFIMNNVVELMRLPASRRRGLDDRDERIDWNPRDESSDRWRPRSRRNEELPWERSDDAFSRDADDRYRSRGDDGYRRRREDDLPWER